MHLLTCNLPFNSNIQLKVNSFNIFPRFFFFSKLIHLTFFSKIWQDIETVLLGSPNGGAPAAAAQPTAVGSPAAAQAPSAAHGAYQRNGQPAPDLTMAVANEPPTGHPLNYSNQFDYQPVSGET